MVAGFWKLFAGGLRRAMRRDGIPTSDSVANICTGVCPGLHLAARLLQVLIPLDLHKVRQRKLDEQKRACETRMKLLCRANSLPRYPGMSAPRSCSWRADATARLALHCQPQRKVQQGAHRRIAVSQVACVCELSDNRHTCRTLNPRSRRRTPVDAGLVLGDLAGGVPGGHVQEARLRQQLRRQSKDSTESTCMQIFGTARLFAARC